ncbi:MAG TPA: 3-deoxy-7-phosphoheptulonate synthase, partial [Bacteroidota bacterium]|nr:3-deoxy-7-phosphoheptulonate synthase [Bacteroidota bacterium]
MLIVMKLDANKSDVERVKQKIKALGFAPHEIPGEQRLAIGITGNRGKLDPELFLNFPGVLDAIPVTKPYKLVSRDVKPENSSIRINGEPIGGKELTIIAGPCSVESRQQIMDIAFTLKQAGVKFLRGGAYKPRTSPYSFQGYKEEALRYLKEARDATGLRIVTEVKDTDTLPLVAEYADVLQIGARNMQNYSLLEAVGALQTPVLLKRGLSATIEEFLMAAEYILSGGNYNVILCERGIRTFEPATRNTLDLNAIPIIKKLSHLPIIVDPSHGIGVWDGVAAMSLAAIAAGADGLIIEVHQDPAMALSDGYQSLKPSKLITLLEKLEQLAPIMNRTYTAIPV